MIAFKTYSHNIHFDIGTYLTIINKQRKSVFKFKIRRISHF